MQIEIEKLAFGGAGVGRAEGKVYFVRGGVPGDVVRIRITRDKGKFAEAEVSELLSPSPQRAEPPCPVFETCGGCQWQNLGYSAQLRAKETILEETLRRIGGISDVSVEPIVPSPHQYGYRARVMLSVWFQGGMYKVGFHEEASRARIAITGCRVAAEPIEAAVGRLSDVLSGINAPRYPLEKIYIVSDGEFAYLSLVPNRRESPKRLSPLCRILRENGVAKSISVAGDDEAEFEFDLLGFRFFSSPSMFMQANAQINESMVKTVLEWADLKGDETALDLYSGIGNFSLHLARRAKRVLGVDIAAKAVALAGKAAIANSIRNAEFDPSPTELFIEEALARGDKFDFILLDPPREGAKEIITGLAKLSARKVIYVSCDPPTLARDLKQFTENGYRVLRIRPFDMFPQTYHVESVALLVKIRPFD